MILVRPLCHKSIHCIQSKLSQLSFQALSYRYLPRKHGYQTLFSLANSRNEFNTITTSDLLPFKDLPYKSIEIDIDSLSIENKNEFESNLISTINYIKDKQKKNCIYIKCSLASSSFMTIASKIGFKYHRAEDDIAYLMLWLPQNISCKVPPFATHHIGVGGVVFNNENKILVIREKSRLYNNWKLPGGLINLGEEISDAAEREIFEETGIKTQFQSVLTFRHSHKVQFDRSDIYIICQLKPITTDIIVDDEIETAQWMDFNEFKANTTHKMLLSIFNLIERNHSGLKEYEQPSTIVGRKPYKIYLPNDD